MKITTFQPITASSEWAFDWSKRSDDFGNAYYVMSCPNGTATVCRLDDGTIYVRVKTRDLELYEKYFKHFDSELEGMQWAENVLTDGDFSA